MIRPVQIRDIEASEEEYINENADENEMDEFEETVDLNDLRKMKPKP